MRVFLGFMAVGIAVAVWFATVALVAAVKTGTFGLDLRIDRRPIMFRFALAVHSFFILCGVAIAVFLAALVVGLIP